MIICCRKVGYYGIFDFLEEDKISIEINSKIDLGEISVFRMEVGDSIFLVVLIIVLFFCFI